MRQSEIKVGGLYLAKVSNNIVTVRVDAIREVNGLKRSETRYDVTNLSTGRRTTFRSAAKFRAPATTKVEKTPTPQLAPRVYVKCAKGCGRTLLNGKEPWVCIDCAKAKQDFADLVQENMEMSESPVESSDEAIEAVVARHDAEEGEQSPNPTLARDVAKKRSRTGSAGATVETGVGGTEQGAEQRSDPTTATATSAGTADNATSQMTPSCGVESHILQKIAKQIVESRVPRVRGTMVAGRIPNDEQEEILATTAQPELKVLVVCAGAGTGKTSTEEMLEQVLPGNGQYTAFNKSLVNESRTKFKKAKVNSTHSLAFHAVGKRFQHRLPPNGSKMRSEQIARTLGIEPMTITIEGEVDKDGKPRTKTLSAGFLAGQVMVAIRQYRQTAARELTTNHFRYIDGIDGLVIGIDENGEPQQKRSRVNNDRVKEYLLPFAKKAWADLCDVNGVLPFSHDDYVKMWQLGTGHDRPIIAADYILLDEAQDTAEVFLDVLKQQTHALLVIVGDDNQQIYEWRGAVNAMSAFPGAERKLLSQSYRFGQTIADAANTVLAGLEKPTDLVMKGNPAIPSRICKIDQPRCFLYRTNAGAIGRLMTSIDEGRRPHLIGGGADVIAWCEAAVALQEGRPTDHYELACFTDWDEVVAYSKTDEGEEMRLMVKIIEQFGAAKIAKALKNMPKEEQADEVISTAHKSKGREWDSVYLGPDFPLANKMNDSDRRLLYVALTRAKLNLDVSECPPFCGGNDTRDTGKPETSGAWVPGLTIKYTVPMPTEEQQAEYLYLAQKDKPKVSATVDTTKPQPQPAPTPMKQNGVWLNATGFNFVKPQFGGGKWCVRGPAGVKEGDTVQVKTSAGAIKPTKIGKALRVFPDATVYEIME